jgi:hypothetical protein
VSSGIVLAKRLEKEVYTSLGHRQPEHYTEPELRALRTQYRAIITFPALLQNLPIE